MFYTIYKITNKINNKIYIGAHKTNNLKDNYMGSGKLLDQAIEKYGLENFIKETLHIFDNETDMYTKESEIINQQFIDREDTYNLILGGLGGWNSNNNPMKLEHNKLKCSKRMKENNPAKRLDVRNKISNTVKNLNIQYSDKEIQRRKNWATNNNPMKNKEISKKFLGNLNPAKRLDVRLKISNSLKGIPKKRIKCKFCDYITTNRWMIPHEQTCNKK